MKRVLVLTAVLLLAFSVQAEDIELREDHPREYVVQEGDTLWDIASRFLERPWQWPAIWHANPDIENPHLIFPGDVISLVFIGGEPRLMVDDSVRRLSPEVRREQLVGPISTIPYDAIEPFLRHPRIIPADEFDDLPYVIANQDRRVMTGPGDRTYVRGLEDAQVGDQVVVARVTFQFEDRRDPDDDDIRLRRNEIRHGPGQVPSNVRPAGRVWQSTFGRLERFNYPVIGYEMWEAARGEVVQTGDPATLELLSGRREVMEGDLVLPVDEHVFDTNFHPRAMDVIPERARVLAITEAYYGVGHYQIVAINLGAADGIEPGHTFSAFRPGETIRDELRYPLLSRAARQNSERRYVTLPEEFAGQLMVFRPFENISYAIVLDGTDAIRVDDRLYHPDRQP
ncbi:LysM peptidoglycan-binding domain-containing protein [Wenzhouxiangella sp. AB-CW3]|uniref:LysM peptidoglycan-binding domain-containing protein n=1 Tax=Wenzhouxiangella sp. AB-CW3 TaxID=2771012 RepID=UPI00168AD657|nr:LysM domain-containing protein [Wenzhouxiangella sp. AB-CW3]QOC22294.1 LysM peptidoglycan-binding domain-containing protein [Wenzhouxiangella sp. AB-CW3]